MLMIDRKVILFPLFHLYSIPINDAFLHFCVSLGVWLLFAVHYVLDDVHHLAFPVAKILPAPTYHRLISRFGAHLALQYIQNVFLLVSYIRLILEAIFLLTADNVFHLHL